MTTKLQLKLFLLIHLLIWTIIPNITNFNLPLDTIEALSWGNILDFGYWKHPPLSAYVVEFVYFIFKNKDFYYYLTSQIFILINLLFVFKICFFKTKSKKTSLYCTLLTSLIFYYSYSSTEFNVNICIIPLWTSTIYYFLISCEKDKLKHWIKLGITSGLAFLSKYLIFYLLLALTIIFFLKFFKIFIKKKKLTFLVTIFIFLLIISPHVYWVFKNDFVTIKYGALRLTAYSGGYEFWSLNHMFFDYKNLIANFVYLTKIFKIHFSFIFKQFLFLFVLFIFHFIFFKKHFNKHFYKDDLFLIFILPLIFIFISSIISSGKIRTMWLGPFYSISSIVIFLLFFRLKEKISKISYFIFTILYFISPILFLTTHSIELAKDYTENRTRDSRQKRVHFQGKEISNFINNKWKKNYDFDLEYVIGDEWYAGNLSYHLNSRPKVYYHDVYMKNNTSFKINTIPLEKVLSKGAIIIQKKNWHNSSLKFYEINKFFFLKDEKNKYQVVKCNLVNIQNEYNLIIYILPPKCKL